MLAPTVPPEVPTQALGAVTSEASIAADGALLTLDVVHLEGVVDLPASRRVDLRVSADGVDIVRSDGDVFGRLQWADIDDLFVGPSRGRRLRREQRTILVLRTGEGEAVFEVPALSQAQLRGHIDPLAARFLPRSDSR